MPSVDEFLSYVSLIFDDDAKDDFVYGEESESESVRLVYDERSRQAELASDDVGGMAIRVEALRP